MSTWAKKIEENWFLEILQSKGFVQEKKLLKNLYIYSYLLESFHISCLVSIQVEKNFSVQMLKSLFIEIYPFFKHTQHHLLILPSPPSEEIKKLAQELNLGTTDLPSLLLSLFPAEHYQDYLKRQFVFKHYSSPWLYQNHSRVEYNHFIKRLRENKEGLIVLEGEKGIGKTTLSQYFTYELGCSISSSTDNWLIPFFISLSNLKKEMTVQKFIEYQIFHPDMLAPLTKKNFELLLKHHRIILIIDSIEQVGLNSFAILEEIWDCLLQYIQAGAKIILTTPLDYLFFQYQKQVGIKYYFEQFLSQISVERYQLRPLTLLQIKQYNHENPKIQKAIEYNEVVRNFAKYPVILELIKTLKIEDIQAIDSVDKFFETIILQFWSEKYLTYLGKETLLEFIAEYTLSHPFFQVSQTPSYIENFVLVQFRDKPMDFDLLLEELQNCPFLEFSHYSFYFKHPIFSFYFIKSKLLSELKRNNMKDISYLQHTFLLELLNPEDVEDIIFPSLVKEISHSSFREKGKLLEIWLKIQQYYQPKDKKLPVALLELENLSLNYEYFGNLLFKNNQLSYLQAYYTDFRYSEWEGASLKEVYLRYTHLGEASFKQNQMVQNDWKFIYGEKIQFFSQDIVETEIKQSYFISSVFRSCQILETTLENNDFTRSEWISVKLLSSYLLFNNFSYSQWFSCSFQEGQYKKLWFIKGFIKESLWKNVQLAQSFFDNSEWVNGQLKNVEILHTQLNFSQFISVEMEDVTFNGCDLRGVRFIDSTLTNVIFINTDMREIIFDKNTKLCPKTQESFRSNIF